MEEKKKKKTKLTLIIIIVLSVLLVGALSYIAYDKIFKKDDEVIEKTNNDEEKSLTSDKIYKQFEVLLSEGYFVSSLYKNEEGDDVVAKININSENKLSVTTYYYDEPKTKIYNEIGDVASLYNSGGCCGVSVIIVVTKDNNVYELINYDSIERINIPSKKIKKVYSSTWKGHDYILFEDNTIFNMNEKKYFEEIEHFVDGIYGSYYGGQCGGYCEPFININVNGYARIYGGSDENGNEKYVKVTYNNKDLKFKYLYDEVYSSGDLSDDTYADIYYVDNDNNIYILRDYGKDDKEPTKLEKLSYKFDSYQTNNIKSEDGYDFNEYTVKYDNGKTLKTTEFRDLTKYSKIFDAFNN